MTEPHVPLDDDDAGGLWALAKKGLFSLDAERAHDLALAAQERRARALKPEKHLPPIIDPVRLAGLEFRNRLGLAAGLDKNARAVEAWAALGFGFVEIGTVTLHPQPGNERPRLFRLVDDRAVMNRMGFNNDGADVVRGRLERLRAQDRVKVPLGVNLGKSKITPNDEAAGDYRGSMERLGALADYVVVNVSSPNTPGLRDLQSTQALAPILDAVLDVKGRQGLSAPIFVKLAPALADADALAVTALARSLGLDGVIVSNTTISREGLEGPIPDGSGGISGAPLFARSTAMLRAVKAAAGGLVVIGVGGVMGPASFAKKREAGADLVQVYTGFIYGGPGFPKRLLSSSAAG